MIFFEKSGPESIVGWVDYIPVLVSGENRWAVGGWDVELAIKGPIGVPASSLGHTPGHTQI